MRVGTQLGFYVYTYYSAYASSDLLQGEIINLRAAVDYNKGPIDRLANLNQLTTNLLVEQISTWNTS